MTDAEAEMLSQHPKVEYIHYQTSEYPEKFASDEDEIILHRLWSKISMEI